MSEPVENHPRPAHKSESAAARAAPPSRHPPCGVSRV